MSHVIEAIGLLITIILQCNGVSLRRQLEHIAKTRLENLGLLNDVIPSRRYELDPRELSQILGVPNRPSHLPEAEAILPGHTLNRPTLGMLKSSLKFPHRELEDGAGVYGSFDNLGMKFNAKNERVLYTGFRRFPADFIVVIPSNTEINNKKPSFKVTSTVLDLESKVKAKNRLLNIIKELNNPAGKSSKKIYVGDFNKISKNDHEIYKKEGTSQYLNDDSRNVMQLRNQYEEKSALRNSVPANVQEHATNASSSVEQDLDLSDKQTAKAKKINWLYNSKDIYDHIKIDQEAPELNELVPPVEEKDIRQWWFYSADDYKQFT